MGLTNGNDAGSNSEILVGAASAEDSLLLLLVLALFRYRTVLHFVCYEEVTDR